MSTSKQFLFRALAIFPKICSKHTHIISGRCPNSQGAFAFMNGFTSPIAALTVQSDQNAFWFGWKHIAIVSSVIVTTPDGLIRWAAINYPGMNQSTVFVDFVIITTGQAYGTIVRSLHH